MDLKETNGTVIISVLGRKGGITKSTTVTTIAAALALLDKRVLVVETDGQGNSSKAMGIERYDGFLNLIKEDQEWADVMTPVPWQFTGEQKHLHLVSASDAQWEIEGQDATAHAIINRFQELYGYWDFVLVDTSPSMNFIHKGLHLASTHVLLPTIIEEDSVLSVRDTLGHLEASRSDADRFGIKLADVLGILPNRFTAQARVDRIWYKQIHKMFGQHYHIFKPVREYKVWKEARAYRNSIWVQGGRWADNARNDMIPLVERVSELSGIEVTA